MQVRRALKRSCRTVVHGGSYKLYVAVCYPVIGHLLNMLSSDITDSGDISLAR